MPHELTDPPATVVAADGSARGWSDGPQMGWPDGRCISYAFLGSTGSWFLCAEPGSRLLSKGMSALHAELYAILMVLEYHPGEVQVLSDCLSAVNLMHGWQEGKTNLVPGYRGHRMGWLWREAKARGDTLDVRWVRGHSGHQLNDGADALAGLASRPYPALMSDHEVERRACRIAAVHTSRGGRWRACLDIQSP